MEYILIAFLNLSRWEAGGAISQEFKSSKSCELAKKHLLGTAARVNKAKSNRVEFQFIVCVKK